MLVAEKVSPLWFILDLLKSFVWKALEVIRELQKHFPIKRSPMRLRLTVPEKHFHSLMEKLNDWSASIISKDEAGSLPSVVSFLFLLIIC